MMKNSPTFNPEFSSAYYENASYSWSDDSIRCMNTVSPHTHRHYLYVQECGYFKTKVPYYTERASLPSYLLLYTLSGNGLLTYKKQSYSLTSGSCFFIDCMEPHRYEASDVVTDITGNWEFLWIHFYGNSSNGYYEDFASYASPVLQIQDTFLLESNLRRIIALQQKKVIYAELLTANLIHSIVTELLIQQLTASTIHFHLPDEITQVLSYLQAHYTESISLDIIAGQVNLSKFYLSREFTKYMGVSINQYIINSRINRAKELLRESNLPVSEIAFQVGVPHVSHFIHLFKCREGITPLEYRKLW